jgi:rod shape-determining protein MreC
MEHQPPPFFNRGPAPLVRLTFFVSLAILLMVLDARFRYAESVRQVVALAAYPIQRVAMAPADLFHAVANYFGGTAALQEENAALKTKQLRVAPELLQLEALKEENNQLRRLLDAQERTPRKSVFAEILYAGRDPFSRKVVIDKGSQSGIQPGQPVIDDVGVIGQVTRVYLLMSEVTLLSDKDQAIPLQVLRNGLRAVAYGGAEGGMLDLRFMAANADIRNGDTLVTSGIDGTYPPGLPVATVARIERDAAYAFAKITLTPTAGTNRYRQVLVLSSEAKAPPPPAEAEEPAQKPPKTKRSRKRE